MQQRPLRRRRSSGLLPLATGLILVVGALTYSNALDSPFLWDDDVAIVRNETIQDWTPLWRPFVPPAETPTSRRPIVNASFALNYAAGGLDPTGYHLWNLAVHVLAALMLFAVVRRTLRGTALRDRFGRTADATALAAALWWMVHPLISEVIAYTTQRTESMMGLLMLTTLYCAIRAADGPYPQRWHAAAALAYFCGLATKESMAVAPLVVALYDRTFVFAAAPEALRARRRLYGAFAAGWIALGLAIWFRPHSTIGFSGGVSAWTYALNQARTLPRYLWLALWPEALVLDYGWPQPLVPADVAAGLLLVAALLVLTLVALRRWPRIGFLAALFFITLAPSSSIIPIATEVGAERRMYLPLASIAVLLSVAAAWLVERAGAAPYPPRRVVAGMLVLAVAWTAALATRTHYRNREFASPALIWRTSIERHPNGRARTSYALALVRIGDRAEALRQLRAAVVDYPDARFGLATELATNGRDEEAVRYLSAFIGDDPDGVKRIPAHVLLGQLRARQGRTEEAIREFEYVLRRSAGNAVARVGLADTLVRSGAALLADGKPGEAEQVFERALAVDPPSFGAHLSLADLLLGSGRTEQAAAHARAALAANPASASAYNTLGIALAMEGKYGDAAEQFRQALRLEPNLRQARNNLVRAVQAADATLESRSISR